MLKGGAALLMQILISSVFNKTSIIRIMFTMLVPRLMIGLEVNADKTKYMVMSLDQNAVRSHNLKNDNTSFQRGGTLKKKLTILNGLKFHSGKN